jgi:xylulokinase
MMMEYLIGVDIGTQAAKGVLVRPDGVVERTVSEEYRVLHPHPLWAEQWPRVWLEASCTVIQKLLQDVNQDAVTGICISGLYGGSGIPLNIKMEPVRPCLIWMDRRATEEVEWVRQNVDLDRLFSITGNWVDSYFGYTKILWIKEKEPENWEEISLFLPPNSYVNFCLTGEIAIDHSSAGNLGGLYDINTHRWSEEMAEALGIPLERMPGRIVASQEVIGEITPEGSQLTGLAKGTPVLAGGIDAPMATLAAGALSSGDNVAMMGTSTCWGVIHHGESYAKSIVSMPHVVNPTQEIYSWAGSATSGALAHWFRETLAQTETEKALQKGQDAFQLLDREAKKVRPGCEGLLALPYFMGERAPLWDPHARGAWVGLSLSHTRGHLFRALLEATAFSLRHAIELGETTALPLKPETSVVGGVAKSQLWLSILADVTGRPIHTLTTEGIGAPLADAFLVGLTMGLVDHYEQIHEWIHYREPIIPNQERHKLYNQYYLIYRRLYEDLQHEFNALARLSQEIGN